MRYWLICGIENCDSYDEKRLWIVILKWIVRLWWDDNVNIEMKCEMYWEMKMVIWNVFVNGKDDSWELWVCVIGKAELGG